MGSEGEMCGFPAIAKIQERMKTPGRMFTQHAHTHTHTRTYSDGGKSRIFMSCGANEKWRIAVVAKRQRLRQRQLQTLFWPDVCCIVTSFSFSFSLPSRSYCHTITHHPTPCSLRTTNPCGMSNFPEVNILNLLACVANAPRLRCTKRRHIATIRCGKGNRTAAGKCAKSPSNGVQWPTVQWAMWNPSGMVKRSAL